ncbi:MAG: hypothetical protein ABI559_03415 [Chloroflexota bacterium]
MTRKIPAAQSDDWERALRGVDFPISKLGLIRDVRENGGIDHEVIATIEKLRNDGWDSQDELVADIRAQYVDDGFDSAALPV